MSAAVFDVLSGVAAGHGLPSLVDLILERLAVDTLGNETRTFGSVLGVIYTISLISVDDTVVDNPDGGVVDVVADLAAVLLWHAPVSSTSTSHATCTEQTCSCTHLNLPP